MEDLFAPLLSTESLIYGTPNDDRLLGNANPDGVFGYGGNDINIGYEAPDRLFGNVGADALFGNESVDSLYGGEGNDSLYGGQQNDVLFGDRSDDVLSGDRGADSLTGGEGNDRFAIASGMGGSTPDDADRITDYNPDADLIQLEGGLTFYDVELVGDGQETVIRDTISGEYLAVVSGFATGTIEVVDNDLTLMRLYPPAPEPEPEPEPEPNPTPIDNTPPEEESVIDLSQIPGFDLVEEPVEIEPGIFFLGTGPSPDELRFIGTSNVSAAQTTNADDLQPGGSFGLDLTGAGVRVGVWDGGNIRNTHQEFGNRVTWGESSPLGVNDHPTHVAGTISAAGVDPASRGMASQVSIVSYDWLNDETELAANASGIQLSNHSYGYLRGWFPVQFSEIESFQTLSGETIDLPPGTLVDLWLGDRSVATEDAYFGKYALNPADFSSNIPGLGSQPELISPQSLDLILYDNPNLLSVWSAGNDRDDQFQNQSGLGGYVTYLSSPPTGAEVGWYWVAPNQLSAPGSDGNDGSGYDSIPMTQTAKNSLVVGAVDDSGQISDFSNWGPTDDGRIKPDVVGNGVDVYSSVAASDTAYETFDGTSMAAPNVTGTAALLYEHYNNLFGSFPRSSTGKALLIHTASDTGNLGPDYVYGWGVVDGAVAANFLTNASQSNSSDAIVEDTYTGSEQTLEVSVGDGEPLKVTLVWTDPAGNPLSNELDDATPMLVNDLDLWIVGSDGTTYHPWTLDPANPSSPAVRTTGNHVDNVEQVAIDAPSAGTYTIHIGHSGGSFTQDYSLLISAGESSSTPPGNPSPIDPLPPAEPTPPSIPVPPDWTPFPVPTFPQFPIPGEPLFTGVDLYTFGYYYGTGDAYFGYTYAPSGSFFPGEFIPTFNQTGLVGSYYIGTVYPGWGDIFNNGDVYVTSYFDGDETGWSYQPYNNYFGAPSGEFGLGSEYDYIYKPSFFGPYYDDFGFGYYIG